MEFQKCFTVKGSNIPYYHFHYEKEFSEIIRNKDLKKRNYYFKDGTYLPQFINQETAKQFDFNSDHVVFDKALVIIIHSFANYPNSDLDNYSYKPFIDNVRKQKIVVDDTWDKVSLSYFGVHAETTESIDMYVVPHAFSLEFMKDQLQYLFTEKKNRFNSIKKLEEIEIRYNEEGFY